MWSVYLKLQGLREQTNTNGWNQDKANVCRIGAGDLNVDGGWNESRGSVWNDEGIAWIEVSECIYEDCNSEVRIIVRLIMFSM